jgi:hypothetical protein
VWSEETQEKDREKEGKDKGTSFLYIAFFIGSCSMGSSPIAVLNF